MVINQQNALRIAITGPAGSGKTTVAKAIASQLCQEHPVAIISFADPMKDMLEALGVPRTNLRGGQDDKMQELEILNGRSARQALQTLGTEWGRDCMGRDIWVRAWAKRASQYPVAIADDCRFENEARMIMSHRFGFVVKLRGRQSAEICDHSSESGVRTYSMCVDNSWPREPHEAASEIISRMYLSIGKAENA